MIDLLKFRKDKYSQNGEDGILEYIFSIIKPNKTGYFVEFGAWDGKYFSNTFNLVEKGWSGLYIESDRNKFDDLIKNLESHKERVVGLNCYVDVEGENSLDNILKRENVKIDFDILSIDVDGMDYYIWESLKDYNPKVVIIEINSSIPVGHEQLHNIKKSEQGSSYTSTINLGISKNYKPICHTGNLIFLRNDIPFDDTELYKIPT